MRRRPTTPGPPACGGHVSHRTGGHLHNSLISAAFSSLLRITDALTVGYCEDTVLMVLGTNPIEKPKWCCSHAELCLRREGTLRPQAGDSGVPADPRTAANHRQGLSVPRHGARSKLHRPDTKAALKRRYWQPCRHWLQRRFRASSLPENRVATKRPPPAPRRPAKGLRSDGARAPPPRYWPMAPCHPQDRSARSGAPG